MKRNRLFGAMLLPAPNDDSEFYHILQVEKGSIAVSHAYKSKREKLTIAT
jgi:hypothetical protein